MLQMDHQLTIMFGFSMKDYKAATSVRPWVDNATEICLYAEDVSLERLDYNARTFAPQQQ